MQGCYVSRQVYALHGAENPQEPLPWPPARRQQRRNGGGSNQHNLCLRHMSRVFCGHRWQICAIATVLPMPLPPSLITPTAIGAASGHPPQCVAFLQPAALCRGTCSGIAGPSGPANTQPQTMCMTEPDHSCISTCADQAGYRLLLQIRCGRNQGKELAVQQQL